MSVNWEFLAGDTSRFALKLSLAPDPYEGRGVSKDMSASWGSFELWIDGRNVCVQSDSGETVEAVHWYLLPLLEWLVEHWDPLLHEERLPVAVAGPTAIRSLHQTVYAAVDEPTNGGASWQPWWSRHSLAAARAGGLFPEVVIRRWRDKVELSWDSLIIPGAPRSLAFTAPQGSARLPVQDVADPLATVLRAITTELGHRCHSSPRIAQLIASLKDLDATCHFEQRVAWLAGLGSNIGEMLDRWQSVAKGLASSRVALTEGLADSLFVRGTPKASLMFGAVAPNISQRDVDALTAFMLALYAADDGAARADDDEWVEMTQSVDERSAPWRQGYELAQSFLERIESDQSTPTDIDDLLGVLGIAVSEVALEDSEIRGLAAAGAEHHPFIGLNPNYPFHDRVEVQRFTKGHELCHVLFDRTAAKEVAVASGPWAPVEIEQRANAFAAMVLMPEPLVRAELSQFTTQITDLDQLTNVAARLGVSIRALAWHATNLGLVSRTVTQLLSMPPRADSGSTAGL